MRKYIFGISLLLLVGLSLYSFTILHNRSETKTMEYQEQTLEKTREQQIQTEEKATRQQVQTEILSAKVKKK